ncbi:MAG: glycosyltransferase family 9 protein [Planctomycetota bacterium]|nr:glycosyltransferase family 9 protein [Planctomycetota bacterium]
MRRIRDGSYPMTPPHPARETSPAATSGDERILLVRLSHLGDIVHALPVYHALRLAHPGARLAWAVQPEYHGLLTHLPGCERLVAFGRDRGAGAWLTLRRELAAFGARWAVDCQGNWKSAVATRLSGAPRRSGLHASEWREPGARFLVPGRPAQPAAGMHAVDRMLHLARHLVPGAWPTPETARAEGAFDLGLPAELLAEGRRAAREQLGDTGAAPPVILALGRAGDPRSWSLAHSTELVAQLAAAGRRVLVLSGPAEADQGRALLAALEGRDLGVPPIHWIDQRGLAELAAYLAGAAELGTLFVSADSGPMHLAWAMGLEVLGLAGPQDPRRTGPWPVPSELTGRNGPPSPHRVLTATDALPCRPCLARTCSHPRGPVCLDDLDPERVAEAVLAAHP